VMVHLILLPSMRLLIWLLLLLVEFFVSYPN
jgi:hypothetical protein